MLCASNEPYVFKTRCNIWVGSMGAGDFVVTSASSELGGYDWVLPACKRSNPCIRIYAKWITS
jgi:hypothetical protein